MAKKSGKRRGKLVYTSEGPLSASGTVTNDRLDLSNDARFKEQARSDLEHIADTVKLAGSQLANEMFRYQTMTGHALEGHGAFRGVKYPNVTIHELIKATGRDPAEVRGKREEALQDAESLVRNALDGSKDMLMKGSNGDGIGGLYTFDRAVISDPKMFLWGFYVAGGIMDNGDWRLRMKDWAYQEHGLDLAINTGESFPVDTRKLRQEGLTIEDLARGDGDTDQLITDLKQKGVIIDQDKVQADKHTVSAYFRHTSGRGGSDDTSLIYLGLVYGMDAMLGGFLADWMDTMDKYCDLIHTSGRDQSLADEIREDPRFIKEFGTQGKDWLDEEVLFPFLLFGNSRATKYLWKDRKNELRRVDLPSSSQSYFNREQIVPGGRMLTAFEAHQEFVRSGTHAPSPRSRRKGRGVRVAFEKVPYDKFAKAIEDRIHWFNEEGLFPDNLPDDVGATWYDRINGLHKDW